MVNPVLIDFEQAVAVPSAAERLQQTRDGLFFIVGSGRCGSTVLRAMFDSHSMLAVPSETGWFAAYEDSMRKKFESSDPAKRRRVFQQILKEPRIQAIFTDPQKVLELTGESPDWNTLFTAILTVYREDRGRARVGEKTPKHISRIDYLASTFPNAKFIHIIRDPRAVVASYLGAAHYKKANGGNPIRAIGRWTYAYEVHKQVEGTLGADRYAMVTYENLVSEPQQELERLCKLLNVPFEEAMLDFSNRAKMGFLRDQNNRDGMKSNLHTGSVEKWRTQLPQQRIELIEHACVQGMEELGYVPLRPAQSRSVALEAKALGVAASSRDMARGLAKRVAAVVRGGGGGPSGPPPEEG